MYLRSFSFDSPREHTTASNYNYLFLNEKYLATDLLSDIPLSKTVLLRIGSKAISMHSQLIWSNESYDSRFIHFSCNYIWFGYSNKWVYIMRANKVFILFIVICIEVRFNRSQFWFMYGVLMLFSNPVCHLNFN